MPESIFDALEEDSYNILWEQQPEIFSNEDGASAKSRAYIEHTYRVTEAEAGEARFQIGP